MRTLYLILYIVAAVLFLIAAFVTWSPPANSAVGRVNLMALGLLAWVLVPLIQTADRLND
jgi:hypothetical protein